MPLENPTQLITARNEKGEVYSITLGGNSVTTQGLTPASTQNMNIKAMELTFTAFINQSAQADFNASAVFGGWKLTKGADTRFHVHSYAELEKFFNILSRRDFSVPLFVSDGAAVANATTGQMEATLKILIPVQLRTDIVPVSFFTFAPLSNITNATSGTVSTRIRYYYTTENVKDDKLQIKQIPVTLQNDVEADISAHLPTEHIDEIWLDVTDDSNLKSQKYVLGSDAIHDEDQFTLTSFTQVAEWYKKINGFYHMRVPAQAWPLNATVGTKPKLDINLSVPMQPTIYMYSKI